MISSPCTQVCKIDPRTGWCIGCARSLAEIAGWAAADEDAKRTILACLPERRAKLPDA